MNLFNLYAKLTLDDKQYKSAIAQAKVESKSFIDSNISDIQKMSRANKVAIAEIEKAWKNGQLSARQYHNQIDPLKDKQEQFNKMLVKSGDETQKSGGKSLIVLAAIATAIYKAVQAMGRLVLATVAYGDSIMDLSHKLGLSTDAVQEWIFVASQSGTTIDALSTPMKNLAKLAESNNSTLIKLIGTTKQSNGEFKTQGQLLKETLIALSQIPDRTKRAALANEVLGQSAAELGEIMNMTGEELDALIQKSHDLGIVLDETIIKASSNAQDEINTVKMQLKALVSWILFGIDTAPDKINKMIDYIVDKISDTLPHVIGFLSKFLQSEVIDKLIQRASESGPQVIRFVLVLIHNVIMGIFRNLPVFYKTVGEIIGVLFEFVFKTIANLDWVQLFLDIFWGVVTSVFSFLKGIFKNFGINLGNLPSNPMQVDNPLESDFGSYYTSATTVTQSVEVVVKAEGDTSVSQKTAEDIGQVIYDMLATVEGMG